MPSCNKKTIAAGAAGVGVGAAVGGTTALIGAQVATAAAVPTMMSLGGTIVAGVGTTMPLWLPAIQSFSAVTITAAMCTPIGITVMAVGAVGGAAVLGGSAIVGVAVAVHKAKKKKEGDEEGSENEEESAETPEK